VIHDFSFTIPGQPPSVNRHYEVGFSPDGGGFRKKDPDVARYQLVAMSACQRAKPALWEPQEPYRPKEGRGMIVVELSYYLVRDIDCDNMRKAIHDAIKYGLGTHVITNRRGNPEVRPLYDDARYLAHDLWKQTGVKHPRVEVTIRG
jgi:hypothetical protein